MRNIKYLLSIIFLATTSFLIVLASAETVTTPSYNLLVLSDQGGGNASTASYNLVVGQQGGNTSTASYNLVANFIYLNPPAGGDVTPPTWDTQAQSANSASQFGTLNLSANVADETGLTNAFLETNESGSWVTWNGKYGSPLTLSGTSAHASFIWSNYSLEGGVNIGWRIIINDTSGNNATTGQLNFSLLKTISITIANTPILTGILAPGQFNSTTTALDARPLPFIINNTGNFAVNTTIGAGNLFQAVSNPSIYYQFKSIVNETNSVRDVVRELIATFTNIPLTGSPTMVANMTNFTDYNDEIQVHINITVPQGEPPANLTSVATFTAAAAY